MIIIGERINATREKIKEAIEKKDRNFIKKEIRKQIENGADYIDLNAGTGKGKEREKEDIKWLIEIAKEEGISKICIDSSAPDVIEFGMNFVNPENAIINSINGEKEEKEKLIEIVKKWGFNYFYLFLLPGLTRGNLFCKEKLIEIVKKYPEAKIILLTMDDKGIPSDTKTRIEIAEKIIDEISLCGIKKENIFVDCLVEPVSVNIENAKKFINCLKEIKTKFPEVRTTCGLSNISFGLPKRKIINKYFLALCIYEGLDSAIIDPTISDIRECLYATNVLIGKDEFCMNYIKAIREKRINLE